MEIWEESRVPAEQRALQISGKADHAAVANLFNDFDTLINSNRVCCFIFFSYADLPIGKEFEILFRGPEPPTREQLFKDADNPNFSIWSRFTKSIDYAETRAVITAVTQQMGVETEVVPHGWKTITILEFPDGIPEIVEKLPTISEWYESDPRDHLWMCNLNTFEKIKEIAAAS